MDRERLIAEIDARMELRGIAPDRVLSDPAARLEYWQVLHDIAWDSTVSMMLWGHAPGFDPDDVEPEFRRRGG